MIKRFFIWLGWRKEVSLARFIFGLYFSLAFLVFLFFLLWRPGFIRPEARIWGSAYLTLFPAFFLFAIFVLVITIGYGSEKRNWRIAVYNIQKLLSPEDQKYRPIVIKLVDDAKRTKNSVKLSEWMENYRKLEKTRETLNYLEEQRKKLPHQINQTIQDIQILETALRVLS